MRRLKYVARLGLHTVGLYHPLKDMHQGLHYVIGRRRIQAAWERSGRPIPAPDCIKHDVIRSYARRFGLRVMIETGTWKGDTVFAMRKVFCEIHSIELGRKLHFDAAKSFAHLKHIYCHYGDSATILPAVAAKIAKPILFWLDGHFCEGGSARGNTDTPINEELRYLFSRPPRDVILIDDARDFTGKDGYPTIEQIFREVHTKWPGAKAEVADDIFRIIPALPHIYRS